MSDVIVWVDKINNRKQFAGWKYSDECIHEDHAKGLNMSIYPKRFRRTRQYNYIPTEGVATISIVDKPTGKTLDVLHLRGCAYGKQVTHSVCYDCVLSRDNKDKPKGLSLVYRQICTQCMGCAGNGGFNRIETILEDL